MMTCARAAAAAEEVWAERRKREERCAARERERESSRREATTPRARDARNTHVAAFRGQEPDARRHRRRSARWTGVCTFLRRCLLPLFAGGAPPARAPPPPARSPRTPHQFHFTRAARVYMLRDDPQVWPPLKFYPPPLFCLQCKLSAWRLPLFRRQLEKPTRLAEPTALSSITRARSSRRRHWRAAQPFRVCVCAEFK